METFATGLIYVSEIMKRLVWIVATLIFLTGCNHQDSRKTQITKGLYYWRSSFDLSDDEQNRLVKSGYNKLYIKYFEFDNTRHFIAPVQFRTQPVSSGLEIIPVIYLDNRALRDMPEQHISGLAGVMTEKISSINRSANYQGKVSEIQIDCDWTETTRETYFRLLHTIKSRLQAGVKLSASIRLHQVKYKDRTGIPAVDRGMLMLYNFGSVGNYTEANSIYSHKTLQSYLKADFEHYPIRMDIALANFQWGIVFRNQHPRKILDGVAAKDFPEAALEKIDPTHGRILRTGHIQGFALEINDEIRFEKSGIDEMKNAAQIIASRMNTDSFCISIFDVKHNSTDAYLSKEMDEVFDPFRNNSARSRR